MEDIGTPIKIGLVLYGLGFLFHVIGLGAPYWHVHEWVNYGHRTKTYYGVWKWCVEEQRYRNLPYDFCFSLISSGYARGESVRRRPMGQSGGGGGGCDCCRCCLCWCWCWCSVLRSLTFVRGAL